ncbi:YcjF family protein [Methylophaga sp.]|uniref:YcjF family protein n=1 Tax=Methylophaga sp. TaxID=2024840 RepID=UPI0025D512B1|nr:TIGR01620 family protein [Methylophaga sp.]
MASTEDFFKPKPQQEAKQKADISPEETENFFKVLSENNEVNLPDSVETDPLLDFDDTLLIPPRRNRGLKWLIVTLFILLIGMLAWDVVDFAQMLWQQSKAMGLAFSAFAVFLAGLVLQQLLVYRRNQKQLKRADKIREQADKLVHEQHLGNAKKWLNSLETFYDGQPQSDLLKPCIDKLPDYLNDSEVVYRISEDFYRQLDRQAIHIIERTSISSAAMIAVSQLAVVDSLLVVWKTLKMINQINMIYGVRLNRLAQWRLNLRVCKIALGSYASQAGISFFSEQVGIGLGGKILGSVAQGFGVGLYQARIGIHAMQHIRPVAFSSDERPKLNMFANLLRRKLTKLTAEQETD